jgi:hypothetical protein
LAIGVPQLTDTHGNLCGQKSAGSIGGVFGRGHRFLSMDSMILPD